jgi:hypothetical protein
VVPATEAEIRARFRASAEDTVGAKTAARIEAMVDDLENLPSVAAVPQSARSRSAH